MLCCKPVHNLTCGYLIFVKVTIKLLLPSPDDLGRSCQGEPGKPVHPAIHPGGSLCTQPSIQGEACPSRLLCLARQAKWLASNIPSSQGNRWAGYLLLTGWLPDWLADWLATCFLLADWMADCLATCYLLAGWLVRKKEELFSLYCRLELDLCVHGPMKLNIFTFIVSEYHRASNRSHRQYKNKNKYLKNLNTRLETFGWY